jgi:hypothetical protein
MSLDNNMDLVTNPMIDNSVTVVREKDDEYLGTYMYPHKCSANISKKDCLHQCINNKDCQGTEYNPTYLQSDNIHKGICCPKIKINKIIPRRNKFNFGKFYLKDRIIKDNMNTDDDVILV